MLSSNQLVQLFFKELKQYNVTNFKEIARADLSSTDVTVHKAFSSVITRYFIFKDRHPEISEVEHNILYFRLKLDLIARYFTDYPDTTKDNLIAFQLELRNYIKESKGGDLDEENAASL